MINIKEIKSGAELSTAVFKLLGYPIENIKKEWIIGGLEMNMSGDVIETVAEIEPSDPIEFVNILELIAPNMTALQLEKIKLSYIWKEEMQESSQSGFYGGCTKIYKKTLNADQLFKVLKEIFG